MDVNQQAEHLAVVAIVCLSCDFIDAKLELHNDQKPHRKRETKRAIRRKEKKRETMSLSGCIDLLFILKP